MTDTFCTQAWLLVGITRNVRGILELKNEQLWEVRWRSYPHQRNL